MGSFALVLFFSATGLTLTTRPGSATARRPSSATAPPTSPCSHSGRRRSQQTRPRRDAPRHRARPRHCQRSPHRRYPGRHLLPRPGYTADAFIDRDTGRYDLTEVRNGFIAVINDLHKGRDAGKVWSAVIDLSAILLVLVSLTGLILIWFMHKRRTTGLLLASLAAASWAIWRLFVP